MTDGLFLPLVLVVGIAILAQSFDDPQTIISACAAYGFLVGFGYLAFCIGVDD
jgi:hypothetical protein